MQKVAVRAAQKVWQQQERGRRTRVPSQARQVQPTQSSAQMARRCSVARQVATLLTVTKCTPSQQTSGRLTCLHLFNQQPHEG